MISFITHGRNDDWQGKDWNDNTYLDSFYESLSKNLEAIERFDVPYEYLIVEWCPYSEYVMNLPRFKELFKSNRNLKTIVVDKSVAAADGLDTRQYFEYYAKNVGVRQCTYDNIIMVNTDIVIYPRTMKALVNLVKAGLDDSVIYRIIWRFHAAGPHPQEQTGRIQNNEQRLLVMPGGAFPGDVHLTTKRGFVEYGDAYDETNENHRTLCHSGMDSEFTLNWEKNGGRVEWLDESYWHINHNHPHPYDAGYAGKPYKNRPNWGFIDFPTTKINDQLTIIK